METKNKWIIAGVILVVAFLIWGDDIRGAFITGGGAGSSITQLQRIEGGQGVFFRPPSGETWLITHWDCEDGSQVSILDWREPFGGIYLPSTPVAGSNPRIFIDNDHWISCPGADGTDFGIVGLRI